MEELDEMKKELQRILKGHKKFNKRMEKELFKIGLVLVRDTNHPVFTYIYKNKKFTFIIPCTGGDFRDGLNVASKIYNELASYEINCSRNEL